MFYSESYSFCYKRLFFSKGNGTQKSNHSQALKLKTREQSSPKKTLEIIFSLQ